MTWQTWAFLVVAGGAFSYSGLKFSKLIKLIKAQKGSPWRTFKDIPQRIVATIINVLGQKAVLRKPVIGIIHTTIFWGFIIVTVGTLEQFASTLHQDLNFEFMGETLYSAFVTLHDYFTFAIILAVLGAFYRRLVVKPEHLGKSKDATLVLIFTGSLMVSIFLMNGFHFLGASPWFATHMPFSNGVADLLGGFGIETESAHTLGIFFKWVHMCLVLGFAMYIPNSKHLHIIAAGPNTFLKNLKHEKGMKPIKFEDETVTQYGAAKITDLSWKDNLDYYSCTECGRCQEVCPAWNTGKPLSPKSLILDLKNNLYTNKEAILAGKIDDVGHIIDGKVTEDVIWACTSCRACEVACPVFIEQTDKIYEIRRNLVMMESRFPAEAQPVFKNLETNATPWAFSSEDRAQWADGLEIPVMSNSPELDVLLWVGCAGSFDDRNKKVVRSLVSLLKKANVKFAILGKEEKCTGDPARRIGNEYLFQQLANDNVATLNRYNVKKIVTACPHCFNTLKNEYPAFGGNYEVMHHSQMVSSLIKEGKLKPSQSMSDSVTFHDSCYMGRWNGVYEEPRDILKTVTSGALVEMKMNNEKSMCCGAGGGRMFMEETIGDRVNIKRTEQALETGAKVIAANCPFCMTMMNDGIKAKEKLDQVKVLDIAELVDQATT